jgi:hypothetical protein
MGRNPEEVADEVSTVNILAPANAVFDWPNKITEEDFTGWVEERLQMDAHVGPAVSGPSWDPL